MSRNYWIRQMIDCAYEINIVAEELDEKLQTDDDLEVEDLVLHLDLKSAEMSEMVTEFKEHYDE